jgi:DNA-binding CsgD family transcriptional regulator
LCDQVLLEARARDGARVSLGECQAERKVLKRLCVSGREVGFIETPILGLEEDGGTLFYDALIPWVALGVERAIGSGAAPLRRAPPDAAPLHRLTPREGSVVQLLAQGRTNKEIAAQLELAERTVEAHLFNVYRKAGVSNRTSLMSAYYATMVGLPKRVAGDG